MGSTRKNDVLPAIRGGGRVEVPPSERRRDRRAPAASTRGRLLASSREVTLGLWSILGFLGHEGYTQESPSSAAVRPARSRVAAPEPEIRVDPETYQVFVDGEKVGSDPLEELPMTQLYFLF